MFFGRLGMRLWVFFILLLNAKIYAAQVGESQLIPGMDPLLQIQAQYTELTTVIESSFQMLHALRDQGPQNLKADPELKIELQYNAAKFRRILEAGDARQNKILRFTLTEPILSLPEQEQSFFRSKTPDTETTLTEAHSQLRSEISFILKGYQNTSAKLKAVQSEFNLSIIDFVLETLLVSMGEEKEEHKRYREELRILRQSSEMNEFGASCIRVVKDILVQLRFILDQEDWGKEKSRYLNALPPAQSIDCAQSQLDQNRALRVQFREYCKKQRQLLQEKNALVQSNPFLAMFFSSLLIILMDESLTASFQARFAILEQTNSTVAQEVLKLTKAITIIRRAFSEKIQSLNTLLSESSLPNAGESAAPTTRHRNSSLPPLPRRHRAKLPSRSSVAGRLRDTLGGAASSASAASSAGGSKEKVVKPREPTADPRENGKQKSGRVAEKARDLDRFFQKGGGMKPHPKRR